MTNAMKRIAAANIFRCCELGYEPAIFWKGWVFEYGVGVEKDMEQALLHY
jgi:TPR repeat protein